MATSRDDKDAELAELERKVLDEAKRHAERMPAVERSAARTTIIRKLTGWLPAPAPGTPSPA